jgi:hypothetical protein
MKMVRVQLIKPVDENSKKPSLISNNDRLLIMNPCLYTHIKKDPLLIHAQKL